MPSLRHLVVAAAASHLLAIPAQAVRCQQVRADLILHHGKIVTLDSADRIASAVVIRDGVIVDVGDESIAARYSAKRTIDLRGHMLMPRFEAALKAFGRRSGDGDEWLRVGALKVFVDGGFTGPSAYTLAPYKGLPGFRGTLNRSPDSLYQVAKAAHALGWQMGFHTIGDYLNHFSMLPPDSTLATMLRDSILVAQQSNFTYTLEPRYWQTLEGARLAHNNPEATPMNRHPRRVLE